jgi:hypothetical protein
MSTLSRINFTPVSDILPIQRRDFALNDPTLANPTNPVALVDGEWMTLNTSYQAVRAALITGVVGTAFASVRSFPVFAEKGRYDVQAMSLTKTPLLYRGDYEFDTRIYDIAATVHAGAAITFIMQPLKVALISFGGRNFSGLVGHGTVGGGDVDPIVGYCTRLPTSNGGQLRFISGWAS